MSSLEKTHPYHIVNPSKWPFFASVSAFIMAVGGIVYMHEGTILGFVAGLLMVLYTSYVWWRDVVSEAEGGVDHTPEVRGGLLSGMGLFIASEVMFFFGFFWAYFDATIPFLSRTAHDVWPPEGIVPFDPWGLPFINTVVLLTSGVTLTYAHKALLKDDRKGLVVGLAVTIILGLIFTATQAYEYGHAAFGFTDGIYSSTFYLATGFHGFHVIVGTVFLIVCFFRAQKGHFTPEKHVGFTAAAWYWHFVDVVWIFLFISIYWWGSSGYTG